jgi:AcrR family transcriptional regulator
MDAVRTLVLEGGPRHATIAAVAGASGASTGSIYHRFDSIDELLARAWMRAIRGVQSALLSAEGHPIDEAAVAGALAVYDFCLREREDALLASSFKLSDFPASDLSDATRAELGRLNREIDPFIDSLARWLGGAGQRDAALLVIRDLPYGAALPHVRAGTRPPRRRRRALEVAVRAALIGSRG